MARLAGNVIVEIFDQVNGEPFNAIKVVNKHNGTPYTDSDVDNEILFKVGPDFDGGYAMKTNGKSIKYDFETNAQIKKALYLIVGDRIRVRRGGNTYDYEIIAGEFSNATYRTSTVEGEPYKANFTLINPKTLYADDGYIIRLNNGLFARLVTDARNIVINHDIYEFDTASSNRQQNIYSAVGNVVISAFCGKKVTIEINQNLGAINFFSPAASDVDGVIFQHFTERVTFKIGRGTMFLTIGPLTDFSCRFDVDNDQQIFSMVYARTANTFIFRPTNPHIYPQWFGAVFDYEAGESGEIRFRFDTDCTTSGTLEFNLGEVPYIQNRLLPDSSWYDNYDYTTLTTGQKNIIVSVPVVTGDTRDIVMRKVRMAMWRHPKLWYFYNIHYIGEGTDSSNRPYIVLKTTGCRQVLLPALAVGATGVTIVSEIATGANPDPVFTDNHPPLQTLFAVLRNTYQKSPKSKKQNVVFVSGKDCAVMDTVVAEGSNITLEFFIDVYSRKTNLTGKVLDGAGYVTSTNENIANQGAGGVFWFMNTANNLTTPAGRIDVIGHNTVWDGGMDRNKMHFAEYVKGYNIIRDTNSYAQPVCTVTNMSGVSFKGISFVNAHTHCLNIQACQDILIQSCKFVNAGTNNGCNVGGLPYSNWRTGDFFGNIEKSNDYSKSVGWRNSIRVLDCDALFCADFGIGDFLGSDVFVHNCRSFYCGNFRRSGQYGKGGGFGCESGDVYNLSHKTVFSNIHAVECISRGIHIDGSGVHVIAPFIDTVYSQYSEEDFVFVSGNWRLNPTQDNAPTDLPPLKMPQLTTFLTDDIMYREAGIVLSAVSDITISGAIIKDSTISAITVSKRGGTQYSKNISIKDVQVIRSGMEAIKIETIDDICIKDISIDSPNQGQLNPWNVNLQIGTGDSAILFRNTGMPTTDLFIDGVWLKGDITNTDNGLLIDNNITVQRGALVVPSGVTPIDQGPSGASAVINDIY